MMKLGRFYRVGKFVGDIRLYANIDAIHKMANKQKGIKPVASIPCGSIMMPVKLEYAGVARVVYVKAMCGETMGWFGIVEDVIDGVGSGGFNNYFQEINSESDANKY